MAWSYKIKLGISYGLIALWVLICDSDLATSSTLMMHAYGTVVSSPGGKNSSMGNNGGKSLVTDSKKSLISVVRILRFPEHCGLARTCRLSQLIITPAISFKLFYHRF